MTDFTELIFAGDLHSQEPKLMPLGNPVGPKNTIPGGCAPFEEPRDRLSYCPEGITVASLTYWRGGRQLMASGMPNEWFASAEAETAGPQIPEGEPALETNLRYNNAVGFAAARRWKEASEIWRQTFVGPRFVSGMAMVDPEALGYDKFINPQVWRRPVDALPSV